MSVNEISSVCRRAASRSASIAAEQADGEGRSDQVGEQPREDDAADRHVATAQAKPRPRNAVTGKRSPNALRIMRS